MHCTYGYLVLVLAFTLSAIDLFACASRLFSYVRSIERGRKLSIRSFWNFVILGREDNHVLGINNAEYTSLIVEDVEELDENIKTRIVAATAGDANAHDDQTPKWINKVRCDTEDLPESPTSDHTLVGHRLSRSSQYSDAALPDQAAHVKSISLPRRLRQFLFGTLERFLVFAGFAQLMHGIVIYTGGCREHYLNGCLAHIISKFIIIFPLFSALMIRPYRGRDFLVLRSCYFCPFPWVILRVRLGLESFSQPACLRGVRRIFCDICVWHNQYLDGTLWRANRRTLYQQANSAH